MHSAPSAPMPLSSQCCVHSAVTLKSAASGKWWASGGASGGRVEERVEGEMERRPRARVSIYGIKMGIGVSESGPNSVELRSRLAGRPAMCFNPTSDANGPTDSPVARSSGRSRASPGARRTARVGPRGVRIIGKKPKPLPYLVRDPFPRPRAMPVASRSSVDRL